MLIFRSSLLPFPQEVTTVSESVDARDGNWVKIGVYKLLQEWLNNPSDNLGLVVTANDSEGRRVAVTNPVENPSNVSRMVAVKKILRGDWGKSEEISG